MIWLAFVLFRNVLYYSYIVHALRICAKGTSHNFPADFSRQMNVMSGKFTVFIVATHHPEIKYFSLFSHQLGV